ncbi:MAG: carbamate kinase [Alphaproteobacteria bacterium]|nr:carbamate kinase [Alphaproteobacteria bacterium]
MRVVVALGGNALLHRGEALSAANQQDNVKRAAAALAPLARDHELIVTHGNGPQVGLLALQGESFGPDTAQPLDVLDAETEGMIGYLIERELGNLLPGRKTAALLTQIEVDPRDPAFANPTKPIGPVYDQAQAEELARARGWTVRPDGERYRRVVPSPAPMAILEIGVIRLLVDQAVIVVCAGGGGIPVVRRADGGFAGVEAVIDKDAASALLARDLDADALLMLTDVDAVYEDWGTPNARPIRQATPEQLAAKTFAPGSMAPKVQAARDFATATGGVAGIGRLEDAGAILDGTAGTLVAR